jgi:hypothetical protein
MTTAMNNKIAIIVYRVSLLYEFVFLPPFSTFFRGSTGVPLPWSIQFSLASRNSIIASLYSTGIVPEVCSKMDQAAHYHNHGP